MLIAFVAVTGAVGYKGIKAVARSLHIVGNEEAPIVDMANEMKLALMVGRNAMEEFKGATAAIATDDEVRNLSMRAADAAKKTADLIEGTVKKVKDGSELVTSTNEAFTQVAENAAKVGELVSEIAAASNEQAQGIEQTNKAVAEMDKVTQQNAASAEESASASEEMNAQAEQMKGIVGDLVSLVGGSAGQGEKREPERVGTKRDDGFHEALAAPAKRARAESRGAAFVHAKEVRPEQVIPYKSPFRKGGFRGFQ